MHSDNKTPGLKRRRNKDGTTRLYWAAPAHLVKKGYRPEAVRLFYVEGEPGHDLLIAAACLRFQAEMLAWASGQRQDYSHFDGTIGSLSRRFQTDKESPMRSWKFNTVRSQVPLLAIIEKAFGKRSLAGIHLSDLRRWYDEAKKPKKPNGKERIDRACKIMKMLRELVRYGIAAEIGTAECKRLRDILMNTEFPQASRRRSTLTLKHVQAFIPKAIDAGRLSPAIGTAVQFETAMRQRDVIGEWVPLNPGEEPSGIMLGMRRWGNGLIWSDFEDDFSFSKVTTKTSATVSHDFNFTPVVMELLGLVPRERRIGPLIIDETAGRPYAEFAYAREWRVIARSAGIPDSVWNMDARAGAITEAEDAGADLDEIRASVGHTQSSTTARYSRGAIGKSRKVASMRMAHRAAKNDA